MSLKNCRHYLGGAMDYHAAGVQVVTLLVFVVGSRSSLQNYASGTVYFTLKFNNNYRCIATVH